MKTTFDSTGQDDRERERRLGSVLWNKTKLLLDELQRLQAKQPDPERVQRALASYDRACKKAKEARDAHSLKVQAGIATAIELHRRQLEVLPHRNRTSFLMVRLQVNPKKYGLKQAPDRETVKPLIDAEFKGKPAH